MTHFLELAIAIQRERDFDRQCTRIAALPCAARSPVIAWLIDDARAALGRRRAPDCAAQRARIQRLLTYLTA